jgi:hypothetical protein
MVTTAPIVHKMEEIYSANNITFTNQDAESIVEVYRSQLADITARIITLYSAQPSEKILDRLGVGEQRSSYGTRSITALMESSRIWKVSCLNGFVRP